MGGTSIRDVFKKAFGENLFLHYNEAIKSSGVLIGRQPGKLGWPELEKLAGLWPVCIDGHLRNSEGTGVDNFYPKATQFATVRRDPAEAGVDVRHLLNERTVMVSTLDNMTNLNRFMSKHFAINVAPPRLNESERSEAFDPEVLKRWISRNEREVDLYRLAAEMERAAA